MIYTRNQINTYTHANTVV